MALRSAAAQVMAIRDTTLGDGSQYVVRFRGQLIMDSIAAYALVAERFGALGHTALFRKDGDDHAILAVKGVLNAAPSRAWINAVMFVLTALSVLWTGAIHAYAYAHDTALDLSYITFSDILRGWPFAVSLLAILLAHEFGHYIAARIHKVSVTLPYFLPLPFPVSLFGTMGAFIQLKSPPTNRRVLLDIGIAGPLAGFVVAVPILVFGLITAAPLRPITPGGSFEGNSILYVLAKYAVFGRFLPQPASFGNMPHWLYMLGFYVVGLPRPQSGVDVFINPVTWAGWTGLLVTGLNLIPAGQLDGGHALYVLVGQRARRLLPVILVALVVLGVFWTGWFLWAAIIYFLGRRYAEPLDQITELDPARKVLAFSALVLFVLVITPIPLS
jgi:membrane-associated protease RseP (regulator of RpoE activity)